MVSSSAGSWALVSRALRPTRSAMSILASVVSLGSPGSAALSSSPGGAAARPELALCRLGLGPVPLRSL